MSLFGIHLFYTWLAMTPHRRPGSNKVQGSLAALAHQGRQGYSATKTQTDKWIHFQATFKTKSLDTQTPQHTHTFYS